MDRTEKLSIDIFVAKTRNYDIFVAKIYDYTRALIDSFWGFPRFIDSPTSYATLPITKVYNTFTYPIAQVYISYNTNVNTPLHKYTYPINQVYAPPEWVGEHHYNGEALSVWELGTQYIFLKVQNLLMFSKPLRRTFIRSSSVLNALWGAALP